jgi:predicted lipoprotein with Yx(FWY)xxD motif
MRLIVLTLAGAGVLAACGAAGATNTTAPATSGAAGSSASTISTATTSLGTVLTDSKGFTLYYVLPEKNSTVGACTGGCLTVWPPLVVTGTPTAASGVTGALATVSVMVNGAAATEVTYNGWPLHTFASDTAAGQTGGNGVMGQWFAAMPGTTSTSTGTNTGSGSTPTATPGGYGY